MRREKKRCLGCEKYFSQTTLANSHTEHHCKKCCSNISKKSKITNFDLNI